MLYINIVTCIYLGITLIFIIWNLEMYSKEKWIGKFNKKKNQQLKTQIKNEIAKLSKKKNISEKHLDLLYEKLKKMSNLLLFEDILTELNRKNASLIKKYCEEISKVFQKLTNIYREKDSTDKAYFTHVLSKFPELMQSDDNSINYAMMHFVFDKSIYCRVNAMRFFYHKGNISQIVNSLKKISKRNLYYSPKLLSDNMLEFSGKPTDLLNALLVEFDSFTTNFQMAIINYIRFQKEDRREDLYLKLKSQKYDKEVELSILRYFGTYKYLPAKNLMLEMITNKNTYNYEYRLVSAYALGIYDDKEVRNILMEGLKDLNWFVRKNSAISLSRMKLSKDEQRKIYNLNDKYAKEMMDYIWNTKEMKEGTKNE